MIYQLLVWVFSVVSVTGVPNPRPSGWVSDQANLLDANTEARLNATAEALYTARKVELAIVVVDDVSGSPKQFATNLFDHWKIGSAATDSGVLVLLVMGKRRLEIETGNGMEGALPSSWLASMQAELMVPLFKQKNFADGLVAGVTAISDHLNAAPTESTVDQKAGEYRDNGVVTDHGLAVAVQSPDLTTPAYVSTPPEDEASSSMSLLAGGAGAAGLGGAGFLYAWRRKRNRTCAKCQPPRRMLPLSEVEDDKYLDGGQQQEEQLHSVDYEVMICPGCQDARTVRHNKWFSGYSKCSSCNYKTLSSSSSTLVSATYDHGGEVQVTEDCQHCSYHNTFTRHTSQLTRPTTSSSSSSYSSSSSSSSSGGSFGGGSSSGGGAGSSW